MLESSWGGAEILKNRELTTIMNEQMMRQQSAGRTLYENHNIVIESAWRIACFQKRQVWKPLRRGPFREWKACQQRQELYHLSRSMQTWATPILSQGMSNQLWLFHYNHSLFISTEFGTHAQYDKIILSWSLSVNISLAKKTEQTCLAPETSESRHLDYLNCRPFVNELNHIFLSF